MLVMDVSKPIHDVAGPPVQFAQRIFGGGVGRQRPIVDASPGMKGSATTHRHARADYLPARSAQAPHDCDPHPGGPPPHGADHGQDRIHEALVGAAELQPGLPQPNPGQNEAGHLKHETRDI